MSATHFGRLLALVLPLASYALVACEGGAGEEVDTVDSGDSADDASELVWVSLIDHATWEPTAAEDDPLASHQPAEIDCGIAGWYVEDDTLEIDTNFCNYLALEQPSLAPVAQGAPLRLNFYHFDLVAPEPAEAHVAVLAEGELVWEQFVAIPGSARVYAEEFEAPVALAEGGRLSLHLHNHGQNTWVLQSFEVGLEQ